MITFKELDDLADKAEEILRKYDVPIKVGSHLEHAFLEIRNDYEKHLNPSLIEPNEDFGHSVRETSGTIILCQRLLCAEERGEVQQFVGHLKLLSECLPSQAVPYREQPLTQAQKQNSDKIFELIVALAAAEIGSAVELEGLKVGKSHNPDVLVTIDGISWGFPCKVITSEQPRTLLDRILEGLQQLDHSSANAVVFS